MGRLLLPDFLLLDEVVSDEEGASVALEEEVSDDAAVVLVSAFLTAFDSFAISFTHYRSDYSGATYSQQSSKKRGLYQYCRLVSRLRFS